MELIVFYRIYLSPTESKNLSDLSLISKSDAEKKSNGTITVSNHVLTAFKLLSSSSEAQVFTFPF